MRVAYLDCSMGISGDMTLAALIDAGVDQQAIHDGIQSLNLPGVNLKTSEVIKGGFRATYVKVEHPEQHAHRHLSDIREIINSASALTPAQKQLALDIFQCVAHAEATVHGSDIEKVHFHEVGAIDSIVDIVGAAIGFTLLGVDQIVASPIPTGRGQVTIDHGVCTVPTPGTAELLKGMPLADVPVDAELTTPTGAAILSALVDRFGALPAMTIEQIGYGSGTYDFPQRANLLRIFVGKVAAKAGTDQVYLLETNLDDVSPEIIGYAKKQLIDAGALDVYTTAVQMKKDRPASIVSVICHPRDLEQMESILYDETATLGIRRQLIERSIRQRQSHTVETAWGQVMGKLAWRSGEEATFTPEFDDCARVAGEQQVSLRTVYRAAETAFMLQEFEDDDSADHAHDHDHDSHSHDSHSHDSHSHDHDSHSHDHDHRHDDHHHDH